MRFLAVVITGLSLIAPSAHAFELLNEIDLPKTEYFTVQQIYRGWWILGLLLPLAVWANIGNAIALRSDRSAMTLSIAGAALIAPNLVIFAVFTQPANTVTRRLTNLQYADYGPVGIDARQLAWITYERSMSDLPHVAWINRAIGRQRRPPSLVVNDSELALDAIKVGIGKSLLPCLIANREPGLRPNTGT